MREWMRALMRRRGKRGVNDSESTGKIGQEIPANQPTPLQPMYPERGRSPEPAAAKQEQDAAAELVKKPARAPVPSAASTAVQSPAVAEEPAAQVASPVAPSEDGKLVVE